MTVEQFNELVFDYGANGTDSEVVKALTDDQREVVAMAWNLGKMDDEVINTYYEVFLETSGIYVSEKKYVNRDKDLYHDEDNLITDNYAGYHYHEVVGEWEVYALSERSSQYLAEKYSDDRDLVAQMFFCDYTAEEVKKYLQKDTKSRMYMNPVTGSMDSYDGWWYETEDGKQVNAVDLGEVVEVKLVDGVWVEA